jgi:hypothetical protein
MITNILIGTDPELFLEKDGEIISAEGLIGGTKYEPIPISDKGHAIQEDNIMVEFNIPASDSAVDFVNNINFVKDYLNVLTEIRGCKLNYSASAEINPKYLKTPQAKLFGCEPDFNVYLKAMNEAPKAGGNLRTCGGHIHIGYDNPNQEDSEKIIYAMDAVLGLESILLDPDDRRKEMYGKAGCFRFKSFGVEYRTLSNFWIKTDESITWAYNKSMEAIELINSGIIDEVIEKYATEIRRIINQNDKPNARLILNEIQLLKEKNLIIK